MFLSYTFKLYVIIRLKLCSMALRVYTNLELKIACLCCVRYMKKYVTALDYEKYVLHTVINQRQHMLNMYSFVCIVH